jgi:hypothetical protein
LATVLVVFYFGGDSAGARKQVPFVIRGMRPTGIIGCVGCKSATRARTPADTVLGGLAARNPTG